MFQWYFDRIAPHMENIMRTVSHEQTTDADWWKTMIRQSSAFKPAGHHCQSLKFNGWLADFFAFKIIRKNELTGKFEFESLENEQNMDFNDCNSPAVNCADVTLEDSM